MRFVVHNNSTITDSAFGGAMGPNDLARLADALTIYACRDVASEWGGSYNVRWSADAKDVSPGEVVCALLDNLPDAPGAVAYHDVDGDASPVIYLARSQCNSLFTGSDSVSSALAHEVAETIGDEGCNLYADGGDGLSYAHELCDAVQEWGYVVGNVQVSDFVLKAFFRANAKRQPLNFMATLGNGQPALSHPFETASGGYQIVRNMGTGERQVTGLVAPHRAAKKFHWSSRTARRLAA